MIVKDYMLVKDFDRYQLEKSVRVLLKQGYVPHGSIHTVFENGLLWMFQTMVLVEKEHSDMNWMRVTYGENKEN